MVAQPSCLPSSPMSRNASSVHLFALPELLPASVRLLLDVQTSTALLFRLEGTEVAPFPHSFPLTPSSARVLFALLEAYPRYCSYRSLFALLYPLPSEQEEPGRWWQQELAVRPIRRALVTLLPLLRFLDLQVVSLRGQGYVLASRLDVVDLVRAIARRT
jgi:hypothetical protein